MLLLFVKPYWQRGQYFRWKTRDLSLLLLLLLPLLLLLVLLQPLLFLHLLQGNLSVINIHNHNIHIRPPLQRLTKPRISLSSLVLSTYLPTSLPLLLKHHSPLDCPGHRRSAGRSSIGSRMTTYIRVGAWSTLMQWRNGAEIPGVDPPCHLDIGK